MNAQKVQKIRFCGMALLSATLMISCAVNAPSDNGTATDTGGTGYSVSVSINGVDDSLPRASALMGDAAVSSVSIVVTNAGGTQIGTGTLTKGTSSWKGTIDVSETGLATFKAYGKDATPAILYSGKTTQTLDGSGDSVTVTLSPNMTFDFSSNPGWTATGDWEWGTPQASSNAETYAKVPTTANAPCFGTKIADIYSINKTLANNYLQYGPVDLTKYAGSLKLKFDMWLDNDYDADCAQLQISTDGVTFGVLYTDLAYENQGTVITLTPNTAWSLNYNTAWTTITADLDAYANQSTVYFRWAFQTEDYDYKTYGWYIDNVKIGSF